MKTTTFLQKSLIAVGAATAIGLSMSAPAQALDFSFAGTFDADDDVQLFNFSVGALSEVTLRSWSYAGGTQANGNVVDAGGFDPILALFDGTGELIFEQDDAAGNDVEPDPVTGNRYDVFYNVLLAAGNYTVSVAQYNNFFNGSNLNTGSFGGAGDPFFTSTYGCSNGQFCDFSGDNRTNEWTFDVLNVDSAVLDDGGTQAVPTPAAILPVLSGLLVAARRRKNGEVGEA